MTRATGKDDPALAETSWPMPSVDPNQDGVEWLLRYGDPDAVRFVAAEIVAAYRYLVAGSTTRGATRTLAALRRVHKHRLAAQRKAGR